MPARDAFLHWLYECYLTESGSANIDDFTTSPYGLYYGEPFGRDVTTKASIWLRNEELIEGTQAWGGGVVIPVITAKGISVVESGRSVNDQQPIAPISVITTNISGSSNVNVQAGSHGSTQSNTNTITDDHRQQKLAFADLLEQTMPVLTDLPDTAAAVPGELRAAAQQDDPGVLKSALRTAQLALAGSVGSGLGGILVGQLHPLLVQFGLA